MTLLVDLRPKWFVATWRLPDGTLLKSDARPRHGMGVSFDCPVAGHTHRLAVPFSNPIDGLPRAAEGLGKMRENYWERSGTRFDGLTLAPSIVVLDTDEHGVEREHWHGFIRNGRVE